MESLALLLVDDENGARRLLADYLTKQGFAVSEAASGEEAVALYQKHFPPVALIDLHMPGMDGLTLLVKLRELNPFVQVIVLTAFGSVDTAVSAMRSGAHDFLTKPIQDLDELVIRLKRAASQNGLLRKSELFSRSIELQGSRQIVGDSESMHEIRRLVGLFGPTDSTVLITGESGTGKEVIARSLHAISRRADGPFVAVNASAFPESLLESELFGHEKGAFTGADRQRPGRFELAMHGTIFLDEIAELPASLQVKLLRILETKTVQRLGAGREIPLDLRVIAATNKSVEADIRAGRFREDLFYRLNVARIELPPLRERGGDILQLARLAVDRFAAEMGRPAPTISQEAAGLLMRYHWPGNVRELQNVLQRALLFCEGSEISVRDLTGMQAATEPAAGTGTIRRLDELEREAIQEALRLKNWNMAETADQLGIHRNTLRNKIRDYKIT